MGNSEAKVDLYAAIRRHHRFGVLCCCPRSSAGATRCPLLLTVETQGKWLYSRITWLYSRTMSKDRRTDDPAVLQKALGSFIRAFGLHQPETTPCGQPISVSEAHALSELAQEDELRQVELTRRLRLQKSTVSLLVGQLSARDWVERVPAPEDGRGVVLRLSSSGRRAAQNLDEARRERFSQLLESIPAHERAGVLHALDVMVEALDE